MCKLVQVSRFHWTDGQRTMELIARISGRSIRDGRFSGSFHFSPKHGQMMPHEDTYALFLNGEKVADEIFFDQIRDQIRKLGFQL